MFEKESKEYANKWLEHVKDLELQHKTDEKPEYIRIEEAHQRGAEFGYNKANEWHKVKDEGLPKNNNDGATYLLFTVYGVGGSPVVAHFKERDSQLLMNTWTGAILTEDKIVRWKECVLPKEDK